MTLVKINWEHEEGNGITIIDVIGDCEINSSWEDYKDKTETILENFMLNNRFFTDDIDFINALAKHSIVAHRVDFGLELRNFFV